MGDPQQFYGQLGSSSWTDSSTTYPSTITYPSTNTAYSIFYPNVNCYAPVFPQKITIKLTLGRHILQISKEIKDGQIELTAEDIGTAKIEYIKNLRVNVIIKRAENKAENLLKKFISEVDFKGYREKGYFLIRSGEQLFRIWKDSHKKVDMWERRGEIFIPKNRLCTHTQDREIPIADEALQKLMLIKSNRILEHSMVLSAESLEGIKISDIEKEDF